MKPKRILGIQPYRFLRKNNTDWRHNSFLQASLPTDLVDFRLRTSVASTLDINFKHLLNSALSRVSPTLVRRLSIQDVTLFPSDLRSCPDAIYAYGPYPANSSVPVIWHNAHTDITLLKARGVEEDLIEQELLWKSDCAARASTIALSSKYAQQQFCAQFPKFSRKTVVLPFILRNVETAKPAEIFQKHSHDKVGILFVGRQAKRKGLDLVLAAYTRLSASTRINTTLTVISSMDDGQIPIPGNPDIVWHKELDHIAIQAEMRRAQIFVMPSREETYGLVYLEAMAAGTVCVVPNREPQVSLMKGGELGYLTECSVEEILNALESAIMDQGRRQTLALKSAEEYASAYSLKASIGQYVKLFQSV